MCMLFLEIAMFIVGLISLITGKFVLSKGIILTGTPARIAGGIFMLPIPIALGAGFILGLTVGSDATGIATVIEIVIVLACLGGGYLYANANKPAPAPLPPPQEPPAVPPVQ
jgi:hypothetical protein